MRAEIAARVAARTAAGKRPPGLAAVLVGDNPASQVYVRNKHKACHDAGLASWVHNLPADTTQAQLLDLIAKLNADPAVHGILVQLPLPKQIDEEAVIRAVSPAKDVDCFHPENVGLLAAGHPRFLPLHAARRDPVVATERIHNSGERSGGGRPKQHRRQAAGADADAEADGGQPGRRRRDRDRRPHAAPATSRPSAGGPRSLVAAAGVPGIITPEMVGPGAVVVDVGTNSVDGKLVGDVHPGVWDVAGASPRSPAASAR